jgi:predicted PurR-regulated permease PerM
MYEDPAMTYKNESLYSKITFILLFFLIIFISFKIFASFLMAVFMGKLIAHTLKPIQENRYLKKLKPNHAAYLTLLGLVILVILPLTLFVSSLIRQAIQIENYLSFHQTISFETLLTSINDWPFIHYFIDDSKQIQDLIKEWIPKLGGIISSWALMLASQIPTLFVQTILTLISCLVFLTDGEKFSRWLSSKIPMNNNIKLAILQSFNESSKSSLLATFAASTSQALTIFIAFLILNVPGAVLATGATFIFSFIPFLGSSPAWILGAIYLYVQGSIIKCVLMILFGISAGLIDNVARAVILKGSHGLHPLVGLIAVFGGLQVFGFYGVLVGPIVIAILIAMCEVWPKTWDT